MKIIEDSEFADFISNKPLYYKIKAVNGYEKGNFNYTNPLDFVDKAFKFKCPKEKEIQTFRTSIFGSTSMYARDIITIQFAKNVPIYFDKNTKLLDITTHVIGVCQSCKTEINFLIKSFSDKPWEPKVEGINIFIQKIGQYPPFEIEPENIVQKYLTEEDNINYKKALVNLSVSYGIGAYAYFRRIIENEIRRIIKDISEMDFEGTDKIRAALIDYEKDHQMSNLISTINTYLPKSLQELGDNPIKLLYEQLSGGIHTFSESDCLEKAQLINIVLVYVIKKVNEEKYQIRDVKDAMLKLRKNV